MALAPFKEQDYGIDSEIRFCSIYLSFRKEDAFVVYFGA